MPRLPSVAVQTGGHLNAVTMTLVFATVGFSAVLYAILRAFFNSRPGVEPRQKLHDSGITHSDSSTGFVLGTHYIHHVSDDNGSHSYHGPHATDSTTQPSGLASSDHSADAGSSDSGSSGGSGGGDSGGGGDGGGGGGD